MEEDNSLQLDKSKAEEIITQRIFIIRGQKVMLDRDLAELYGVSTKRFNEQVKRNIDRFPTDFMFRISLEEYEILNRSQTATGSQKHRDPRFLPYAFTEHGVSMLSSVLNSKIAIQMNIFIIRAFIKMRESLDKYKDLEIKVGDIYKKQREQGDILHSVHSAVKHMIEKDGTPREKVGFNEKAPLEDETSR